MTPWLNHLRLLSLEAVVWVGILVGTAKPTQASGTFEALYLSIVLLMTVSAFLFKPRIYLQTLDIHLGCVALALLRLVVPL